MGLVFQAVALGAPREAEWKAVEKAIAKDQPQTAAGLLAPIERQAFAADAWAEGAKALALRVALTHHPSKDAAAAITELAKASAAAPALRIQKTLHVRRNGARGQVLEPLAGPLRRGEELVSRLTVRSDPPLDFVHIKDQRGSGTEPVNTLSSYRWQDGIGFFETARDTASHFFIDALPAGTHVLEASVRVQHAGIYQTGVAEVRCMYAPAFAAHSASFGITVE